MAEEAAGAGEALPGFVHCGPGFQHDNGEFGGAARLKSARLQRGQG